LEYTDKDKLAKTIFDRIMEELEALPPKNWYKINEEVIDDLEGEAKEIQREYKNKLLYKIRTEDFPPLRWEDECAEIF